MTTVEICALPRKIQVVLLKMVRSVGVRKMQFVKIARKDFMVTDWGKIVIYVLPVFTKTNQHSKNVKHVPLKCVNWHLVQLRTLPKYQTVSLYAYQNQATTAQVTLALAAAATVAAATMPRHLKIHPAAAAAPRYFRLLPHKLE